MLARGASSRDTLVVLLRKSSKTFLKRAICCTSFNIVGRTEDKQQATRGRFWSVLAGAASPSLTLWIDSLRPLCPRKRRGEELGARRGGTQVVRVDQAE